MVKTHWSPLQDKKTKNPKLHAHTYNAAVTRSQIHKTSLSTSQQRHDIIYLRFAGWYVGDLGGDIFLYMLLKTLWNKQRSLHKR